MKRLLLLSLIFVFPLFGQTPSGTSKIPLSFAYDQDAQLLFQRMTTPPTETRKKLIDRTIKELKSFGIWYQLDVLYFFAAETQQAALLNWIKSSHNATAVNSPTFAANLGFTGDGATSYVNSNYNASTQGIKYTLNSASVCWYVGTNIAEARYDIGNSTTQFVGGGGRWSDDNGFGRVNQASGVVLISASADSRAFWQVNRSASTAIQFYRNGVLVDSGVEVSTAIPNNNLNILAGGAGPAAPTLYSTKRVQAASFGGSLSASQHYHFNRIIEAYMDAVGAGVQN